MFESERRDLSWVPRFGIIRVNRQQSVAEHSYFVCCYGLEIARRIEWPNWSNCVGRSLNGSDGAVFFNNGEALNALAIYLLRHDEGETLEGDAPGPIKRVAGYDGDKVEPLLRSRYGPAPLCTPCMKAIRRVADLMDECMYLAGERNSGNKAVESVLENSRTRLGMALASLGEMMGKAGEHVLDRLARDMEDAIVKELSHSKNLNGFAGIV